MLSWNLEAEFVSGIVTLIILIYSFANRNEQNLKNKIFRYCLVTSVLTIFLTIISTIMILTGDGVLPNPLISFFTQLYFLFLPAIGQMYLFYILATILEGRSNIRKYFFMATIPFFLYFIMILFNPFTKWFFTIEGSGVYSQGPYLYLTYIFFYFTCILSIILVISFWKSIPSYTARILLTFPIFALGIIFLQNLFPEVILTGTAAMCSLLISYLYLQNKKQYMDPLTELQNRQAYVNKIAASSGYHRSPDTTPLVVSLNNFRHVNDSFGQDIGDRLLVEVANYLKTIIPFENLYRFNGDEFLILNNQTTMPKSMDLAKTIQERFKEPWDTKTHEIMLSMSIGIAGCQKIHGSWEEVITALEYAVKISKQSGENQISCFNGDLLNNWKRKNTIIKIIQEEIQANGFEIYFQPIYSLEKKKFVAGEALIRLNHKELGFIPPSEFIPIAEQTDKINQIGYIVIEKTCAFIHEQIKNIPDFKGISVNLSILQMMEYGFVNRLLKIVNKYQIPPALIKLEVTESVLASNLSVIKDVMETLSKHGFTFSLDDFGTGYANLSYILQLPFTFIKIDRSLVVEAENSPKYSILLHSLITTFKEIGLQVIVEGVENNNQVNFLKHAKCDLIQGYYFAKPMPTKDALPYFKNELSVINQ